MERLTEWNRDHTHGSLIKGDGYTKLARYEDTGLEPEEVERVKVYMEPFTVQDVTRFQEIMQAEKDGRLVILPCKPSQETEMRLVMSDDRDLILYITDAIMRFEAENGTNLDGRKVNADRIAPCGAFALSGKDVLGGITFNINNDWVWLQCGFVCSEHRRKGIYRSLMDLIESWARNVGISGIIVSTYDFEAPEVYERLGFTRGAVLPNCPKGNTSIDYYKVLPREEERK